ncbi:unnamed protein product [Parascedosporium putredinis]|uniref:Uncharacterized protein n=1 Tax=Parascedosporium putredinis TaxID=1442378 RepID=A0A9P1M5R3_9PEZI|nr:unnamed protein product [Parascedosporium putredinis]CAI7988344.1 unnamed protein product [Parascedosporium putredinis]
MEQAGVEKGGKPEVFASILVLMNTWGYVNSFGTFQAYYTTELSRSPSDVAWIGSFQVFLLFFIGSIVGRLCDAGYVRHLVALGSVFQLVGIFATSVATKYWQVFLCQGLCVGLGNGLTFCPCISVLPTYFTKKRGIAIGIAFCGTSIGGLVFPTMVRQLLPKIGFGQTVRAIGFIQVGNLCFMGVYVPFYYAASYSRDSLGMKYTDSLNVLLILNGVGLVGRTLPAYLADHFGPINVFIPTSAIACICVFCWMAIHSANGLYVWASIFGIVAGGVQGLFPTAVNSLTRENELDKMGSGRE